MIEKYSMIFPQLRQLDDEQLRNNYSAHIIHNINYIISKSSKEKSEELKKLLSVIESYKGYFTLEELIQQGFNEENFYNQLKEALL